MFCQIQISTAAALAHGVSVLAFRMCAVDVTPGLRRPLKNEATSLPHVYNLEVHGRMNGSVRRLLPQCYFALGLWVEQAFQILVLSHDAELSTRIWLSSMCLRLHGLCSQLPKSGFKHVHAWSNVCTKLLKMLPTEQAQSLATRFCECVLASNIALLESGEPSELLTYLARSSADAAQLLVKSLFESDGALLQRRSASTLFAVMLDSPLDAVRTTCISVIQTLMHRSVNPSWFPSHAIAEVCSLQCRGMAAFFRCSSSDLTSDMPAT